MSNVTIDARRAREVRITPHTQDHLPALLTLAAGAQDFADLSYTLHAQVAAVVIYNQTGADLHYEVDGTDATATNFAIPDGVPFRVHGDATFLASLNLYSAAGGDISVAQEILKQD